MILVPMTVVGLVTDRNGNGKRFADISVNYELLQKLSVLGGEIEPKPFSRTAPLQAGVHLHFILPGGLTRGIETENGFLYPAVPDRYLVTRISVDKTRPEHPRIRHKAWILESSYVGTDNTDSVTIPDFSGGGYMCRYLGRSYPYEEIKEAGRYLDQLTALGSGTPWFAACYQTCRTVFGFHDRMEDAELGEYLYAVTGWYSRAENSPLYGLSEDAYRARLEQMGFSLAEAHCRDCDADLILHGCLFHVPWDGPDGHYHSAGPQGKIQLAVGNSSAEALSAMAAKGICVQTGQNVGDLERILNLLQADLLGVLGENNGLLQAEDRLHRKQFGELGGRMEWLLKPIGETDPGRAGSGAKHLDPKLEERLRRLNRLEEEAESLRDMETSKKEELYDVWYTYMLLYTYPSPPFVQKPLTKEEILAEANQILSELEEYGKVCQKRETERDEAADALRNAAAEQGLQLERQNARDQYFFPLDPVVLAAGDGVNRTPLFEETGALPVRKEAVILSSVEFQAGGVCLRWDRDAIAPYCDTFLKRSDIPGCFPDLYCEVLFLYLSEGYAGPIYTGVPPAPAAVSAYAPPWNPLFLEWRIRLQPSRTKVEPDNTMDFWMLGDLDYQYVSQHVSAEYKQYAGRTVLTPQAAWGLSSAIMRDVESFRYDEALYRRLLDLAERAEKLPVLSQTLSGMKEALLCKEQSYSFPIFGVSDEAEVFSAKVREAIGDYGELSLNVSHEFLPLRGGLMSVGTLCMVDTFGQIAELDQLTGGPIIAESMRQEPYEENGRALLQPRLAGAARLAFEWENGEAGAICGYLMPDFLNRRIDIYDADGGYLGNLHLVHFPGGGTGVRYYGLESLPRQTEGERHLQYLVQAMAESGNGVFEAFLQVLDERLSEQISTDSTDGQELPFLTGRPLAVMRARLGIRWRGLLPYAKTFPQFGKRNTCGFETSGIPARLGDIRYTSDGLAGYFAGGCTPETYSAFYPAYGMETEARGYFCCNHELLLNMQQRELSGRGEAPVETELTLLLDVRGSVHVRTGVLPVYQKESDYKLHQAAMEAMSLRLPVYPVLGGTQVLNMPQPDREHPFFWHCRGKRGDWVQEIGQTPQTADLDQGKNWLMDGYMSREGKNEYEG
mgnify:CR=1 FL=1|jgi:hypothetical protein